ncbi:SRPBCC family protein [Brevibacterium luteolum]|uniref:SRPBCC family protein n=1 Tax=Brevibacterium luteolum TaxID=199591 RepID=UPI003EEA705D
MTVVRVIAICLSIPVILAAGIFAYSRFNPVSVVIVTELDASPDEVWAVLADTERYSEWNPSIIESSGTVAPGEKLRSTVMVGEGTVIFTPTIRTAEPGRELTWSGRMWVPGLADGEHSFLLEALPGGGTRLTQQETLTGVVVPFMPSMRADLEADFAEVNDAIGERAAELRQTGVHD